VSTDVDPRIGTELAGYRIERLLGRGGMSVVYLAQDLRLGRKVALKLLAPELASDERFRERFLRESRLAASLDHQNVIPIYEAGEAGGVLYIAMRYVEGIDLRERLRSDRVLQPADAIALLAQVASALDAAHEHGLVHRDVKPGNVLIARGGHVYLSDFGLTKQTSSDSGITETGQFVGTVDYVAPEQIERQPVDGRTDEYALACVLFECLTGEAPFRSDSLTGTLWAHVSAPPPSVREPQPGLPEAIDQAIARGMAKRPGDRYPSCVELIQAAQAALGLSGQLPIPPTQRRRRWRLAVAAATAVGIAAAVAVVLATRGGSNGPAAPRITQSALVRLSEAKRSAIAAIDTGTAGLTFVRVAAGSDAAWLIDPGRSTVARVDGGTNRVRTTGIGSAPTDVAVGAGAVWVVGSKDGQARLSELDPASGNVRREFTYPYSNLVAVATNADAVWVAANDLTKGNAVLRIDPSTGEITGTKPIRAELRDIGAGVGAIWATAQAGSAGVGGNGEIPLIRIDPSSMRQVAEVSLGRPNATGAARLVVTNNAVWIVGGLDVVRVDSATNQVTRRVPAGNTDVYDIAAGRDAIWLAVGDVPGEVLRIDPATGRVTVALRGIGGSSLLAIAGGPSGIWAYCSCPEGAE
jgi:serine/threonine-protein kinase